MDYLYLYGPNFASFHMTMGRQRRHVVGCYLAPNYASTIEDVIVAIIRRPQRAKLLVAVNFNADLAKPEGTTLAEDIVVTLEAADTEDMSAHFLPSIKPWSRDGSTWSMCRGYQVLHSRTD